MLKAKPVPTNDKRTLLMIGLDTIEREFQLPAVLFGDARHRTTTCHLGGFCLQQDSQVERSRFRSWVQRLLIKDAPQVAVLVEKFFPPTHPFCFGRARLRVGHAGCLAFYTGGEGSDFGKDKQDGTSWPSYLS